MRMPFNVYTSRMINSLRRHFDYAGYSLHARTELKSGRLVVWIKVKSKGNRPSR
jgi:hypothetical protein